MTTMLSGPNRTDYWRSGFIGTSLTEEMVRLGAVVRAFVHYNSRGDRGLLERLPTDVLEDLELWRAICAMLTRFVALRAESIRSSTLAR